MKQADGHSQTRPQLATKRGVWARGGVVSHSHLSVAMVLSDDESSRIRRMAVDEAAVPTKCLRNGPFSVAIVNLLPPRRVLPPGAD